MTCEKPYSITVAPEPASCPDWSQLLWAAAIISGTNPPEAAGSFTPTSAMGASYQALAAVVDFFTNPYVVQGATVATLDYNGTGCAAQVTVDFTGTGAANSEAICSIRVRQDGSDILAVQSFNVATSGNYTFPLALADTSGNPQQIRVDITWQTTNLVAGGPATVNMAGTFSNVP